MLPLASINPFIFFGKSDLAGQIIFLVLCALSLVAWTTMIGKYLQLKRLRTNNARFATDLAQASSVVETPTQNYVNCPYSELTMSAVSAIDRAHSMAVSPDSQMEHVVNAVERAYNTVALKYESKLVFLGAVVSGAPFLGLLGTVWGVMIAFAGIAMQNGPATIQSLAPGVASALLCTVTGLLVAIPAVFGYNYLFTKSKAMMSELENFASALADRVEMENFATGNISSAAAPVSVSAAQTTSPNATPNTQATETVSSTMN
jgi:biopolymer transport protein TolQ